MNADADRFQTAFDPREDSVTETLIQAVASVTNRRPNHLPVLNDYIDPDALDALFRPKGNETDAASDHTIFFRYAECNVRIDAIGVVTITFDNRV
ncbi:HalOD1 output domain-containing protein [Haloferax namakaokahaiae]|uniref:HalOD1 output domain-containing protein n=1 Tax=Haloferax namakaokahaiae TaxID=1748331 RepID=A0ABD5ZB53_9EURY